MSSLLDFKGKCLNYLHQVLPDQIARIKSQGDTHQKQAQSVNRAIAEHRDVLVSRIPAQLSQHDQQQLAIVLQYCISVVSLEYRHQVWPYEYMALSRRVGELWQRFCSTAWDTASRANLRRITPPEFESVLDRIRNRLLGSARDEHKGEVSAVFDDLRDVIGEINMVEDEVFAVDDMPHVIDFKSGFGSNEKGNMLRLRAVGKAYRLWNAETKLLFLVRQEENNNYLEVIRREGLWDVHCGRDAYAKIDEFTGANMNLVRDQVVDFRSDLSESFWEDLNSQLSDLTGYLRW